MQNKLHTTICHVERSRDISIKRMLLLLLFPLWGLGGYAQNYDWDWAIGGGATLGTKTYYDYDLQQIHDIKIGSDNNYYFVASMNGTFINYPDSAELDGQPVKQYNAHADGTRDVFLFSTTCDGQVRWSQAIGGKLDDYAYNLALDSKNNVYVGARVTVGFYAYSSPQRYYTFFSPTDSIRLDPTLNHNVFDPYLVKYDSNGQYQGKKALRGTVSTYSLEILDIYIDSKDTIHFITGVPSGTHLDNNVTVPNTINAYQFFLAKYDTNLNYLSSVLLPIADGTGFSNSTGTFRFTYDEDLNRYYIAGMRSKGFLNGLIPLTYEGRPFVERSFVLAINGTDGSEAWRREIHTPSTLNNGQKNPDMFTSLIVDPVTSDVYVGGQIWRNFNAQNLKIYDPHNPATTTYTFTPVPYSNLPTVIKFNSSGTVQWLKTPTAPDSNFSTNTQFSTRGLAIRGNEIAFGSSDPYFLWDGFSHNNPDYTMPNPSLIRFNKQTGQTHGIHAINGPQSRRNFMTAVAVDNDGNYVVGGSFEGGIFTEGGNVPMVLSVYLSKYNFFAAKLAASVCGTPVSTEKFNTLNVNVYPNPTTDIVNIESPETLFNYVVYDINGRELQTGLFDSTDQINLQNASNGVYFVKVTTVQGNSATVKVVKE